MHARRALAVPAAPLRADITLCHAAAVGTACYTWMDLLRAGYST